MSDFEERQYRMMLSNLDGFSAGQVRLETLIGNLEGLLNALPGVDKEWKQSFLHFWGRLEDERAVASFRNMDSLDAQAMQRINAAIGNLKLVILEKMRNLK